MCVGDLDCGVFVDCECGCGSGLAAALPVEAWACLCWGVGALGLYCKVCPGFV